MSTDGLARAVEAALKERGFPFDPATLRRFLEDVGPLVRPDDPPRIWADAYRKSMAEDGPP